MVRPAKTSLYIHAVNIHTGGGKTLLEDLINVIGPKQKTVINLDQRMVLPSKISPAIEINFVRNNIFHRILAEFKLFLLVRSEDSVLCFGNLPPAFRLKAFTSVFVQNRFLIEQVQLDAFSLRARARVKFERWWIWLNYSHANQYVVQTKTMRDRLKKFKKETIPIVVLPFSSSVKNEQQAFNNKPNVNICSFIYVASGDPHKNHKNLVKAWLLLAKENIRPKLSVTIDEEKYPQLCDWLQHNSKKYQLDVENLGLLGRSAILEHYKQSDALIYPSLIESFGLPLVEARNAGLPIIAAELDYVRDLVEPDETFDPTSAVSIKRAVQRFSGCLNTTSKIFSPSDFLKIILEKTVTYE